MTNHRQDDGVDLFRRELLRSGAVLGSGLGVGTSAASSRTSGTDGMAGNASATEPKYVVEQGGDTIPVQAFSDADRSATEFYDRTALPEFGKVDTSRLFLYETDGTTSLGVVHDGGGSNEQASVIDDFEDGDLSEYEYTAYGADVRSDLTYDGSYALSLPSRRASTADAQCVSVGGDIPYPSRGDSFGGYLYQPDWTNQFRYVFAAQSASKDPDGYNVAVSGDRDFLIEVDRRGKELARTSLSDVDHTGKWLKLVVDWDYEASTDTTTITATLYDEGPDGTEDNGVLAQIQGSESPSTYESGGLAFNADAKGSAMAFDDPSFFPADSTGGTATFEFGSLPADAVWAVEDDLETVSSGTVRWEWDAGDVGGGMLANPLGADGELTVDPSAWEGIDDWQIVGAGAGDAAGGESLSMNSPVTVRTGADVALDVRLTDVRILQDVENTRVTREFDDPLEEALHREPDPPLATERPAIVGFDLDFSNVDEEALERVLEAKVGDDDDDGPQPTEQEDVATVRMRVTVTREDGSETTTIQKLPWTTIEEMYEEGTLESRPLHLRHLQDAAIFEVDESLASASIELAPESEVIETDAVTVDRSSDFEVEQSSRLRVGFIEVQDPERGENYGDLDAGLPSVSEDDIENTVAQLEQIYPVSSVDAYRHDTAILGAHTHPSGEGRPEARVGWGAVREDLSKAREELEAQLPVTADQSGHAEHRIDEFDEYVALVPSDFCEEGAGPDCDPVNESYIVFHGVDDETREGFHLPGDPHPQLATAVTGSSVRTATPHELAHHFTVDLYQGQNVFDDESTGDKLARHPTAQRDELNLTPEGTLEVEYDVQHARHLDSDLDESGLVDEPGVVSTTVWYPRSEDGGYEGEISVRPGQESIMSYGRVHEPDSRLYRWLLQKGFEPHPPEKDPTPGESSVVLSGVGTFDETDSFEATYLSDRPGTPMASADDGDVSISVVDAEGDSIAEYELSSTDSVEYGAPAGDATAGPGTDAVVSFTVAFPESAAAIEVHRGDTTTEVDPFSGLLYEAVDAVPTDAFERNPRQRRTTLYDKAEAVEMQLNAGAFEGARKKLRNDVRRRVERWLREDYETTADQPTRADLLGLIDDLIDRLDAISEPGDGRTNQGNGNGR